MSDTIQRYQLFQEGGCIEEWGHMDEHEGGDWVRYDDHLAALERARREGYEEGVTAAMRMSDNRTATGRMIECDSITETRGEP